MNNQARQDRNGNFIGDGKFHAEYFVEDFSQFPSIKSEIQMSDTTESVYVIYRDSETHKGVTCRFSNHICNSVLFGDVLNGYIASRMEILSRLGRAKATFIQDSNLSISFISVKKNKISDYEQAELTIQEMYALGEGADLTKFVGKIAKNSNYLIKGDTVKRIFLTRKDMFGQTCKIGHYEYELI